MNIDKIVKTMNVTNCTTQKELLLENLKEYYSNEYILTRMLKIITGESKTSLRIVDWFVTNYAKKYFTLYTISIYGEQKRFNVYQDYKLKLKSYSKKNFDPFCRWERITMPYKNGTSIETTIGQLNFFKWAIEKGIVDYIEENYSLIENDMNARNSSAKRVNGTKVNENTKTRKKREELSISAAKSIKKEEVEIVIKFN
jgi:hypothetical protein